MLCTLEDEKKKILHIIVHTQMFKWLLIFKKLKNKIIYNNYSVLLWYYSVFKTFPYFASRVEFGVNHVTEIVFPILPVRCVVSNSARYHYSWTHQLRDDGTPFSYSGFAFGALNRPAWKPKYWLILFIYLKLYKLHLSPLSQTTHEICSRILNIEEN